ncbi:hypothetical protein [Ruegeria sp. A3M17]|uniref:hypothetical protein n=1 Tax=Ruegeria sp. A3M17 TaxID=2267229 RepID=UPI001F412BAD|nr:hypothetical protein [Ruegeria sp. A3M17]
MKLYLKLLECVGWVVCPEIILVSGGLTPRSYGILRPNPVFAAFRKENGGQMASVTMVL